ncbi:MAG: hypothetical protein WCM76_08575 [Bacteroidota bacterium]
MKGNAIYIVMIAYAIIAALTIVLFNGTGDSGDSITHYLFARYAPAHPQLFFDLWAKPVCVFLLSPFAQFGFTGVKIFNALVTLFTIFFTYKTALKLNIKNPVVSAVILVFSPLFYILTFSGLTEPLFALILILGIYIVIEKKYTAASVLISFLPFVRSEGLIILCVFVFFLLLKNQWKYIPWLLTAHVIFMIAGMIVYGDILWLFTKIPYAQLTSTYGSGRLFHFVGQMNYVTGLPVYILFWTGIIGLIWQLFARKISVELMVLVFAGFGSFFIAHSLFWYFGIFNSMGLKRVLICVIPLISIMSLVGFNTLTETILKGRKIPRIIIQSLLIAYIIIFPFTSNPAAVNWKTDMMLSVDQQCALETGKFIAQNSGTNHRFIFSHPYLSEVLNIDPFDKSRHEVLSVESIKGLKTGDIIIWENWFSVIENGIGKDILDTSPRLKNTYNLSINDGAREIMYAVYQCY